MQLLYRMFLVMFLCSGLGFAAFAQSLSYFLPDSLSYDPRVPKPRDVIYHEVGEWHVTHDRLVSYMQALAAAVPGRIKLETMGYTYEGRPQVLLIITSPGNHANLENIRQQHLQLSQPGQRAGLPIDNMPVVVWVGHSIHGNEPSGSNAALLSAYYLAAAQGKQIEELLEQTVILFDPSFNPDGLQRFSTWANQHKSRNLVSDPNSREFNEVWPGGRFNHYWFDLNRDWLPAVHVESQNRLTWYHRWKPNVLTDHHEQGSNATFFFQPGVPSRVNPLTPGKNQELTAKLGRFHAQFLDRIGSLYFTKENYDDFYYGKGSTYPDINGAVGILFEQASSRGHLQQTANGLLSFPFTIRNQFVTTLSTLEGAKALRRDLLQWQLDFYREAQNEAAASSVKAYVFGDPNDRARTRHFVEMLERHRVDVYPLKSNLLADGQNFDKDLTYVVPVAQPQYRLIRTIFEKTFQYQDSLFYDITSWTLPLAFGLPHAALGAAQYSAGLLGEKSAPAAKDRILVNSHYAYLVEWEELYAPAALYELLDKNYLVKSAGLSFELEVNGENRRFAPGTLLIPVKLQDKSPETVSKELNGLAVKYGLKLHSVSAGQARKGIDLGSSRFSVLTKPSVAQIVGSGVNATDAGEVWHLLDQRMNIPSTHLEQGMFNRVDLSKYNTLLMVGGSYGDLNKDKLKSWVQSGGTLILTEEAVSWAAQNGISGVTLRRPKAAVDSSRLLTYRQREQLDGAQQMNGAIFGAQADLDHPLAWGYRQPLVSLFKANKVFMERSRNPYASPFTYGPNPLQSGWASRENLDAIRNTAAVVVSVSGSGRVISIADNPNFRAFWLGGAKLYMNAIFFGRVIDAASARTED